MGRLLRPSLVLAIALAFVPAFQPSAVPSPTSVVVRSGVSALGDARPSVAQTVGRRAPLRPINSIEGKDLYNAYCEQCHGPTGKGDGPAAAELKKAPADLTQLAIRDGSRFRRSTIERFISGERPGGVLRTDEATRAPLIVYDNRTPDEMPVYGILFRRLWQDQPPIIRCSNLARYIESIQAK